jgi:hypothetical protein
VLREYADKTNFLLELDPDTLKAIMTTGNPGKGIAPVNIRNGTDEEPNRYGKFYEPYKYIYGRYDQILESIIINHSTVNDATGAITKTFVYGNEDCRRAVESEGASQADVRCLYKKKLHRTVDSVEASVFSPIIRLKLIYYMLEGSKQDGGCDLLITKYLHNKLMAAFYPLHDQETAKALQVKCCAPTVAPWSLPFAEMREYFGERFTLFYM